MLPLTLLLLLLLVEGCPLLVGGQDVSLNFLYLIKNPFLEVLISQDVIRQQCRPLIEFSGYLLKLTVA